MRVFVRFGLAILSFTGCWILCCLLLFIGHHQGLLGGKLMSLLLSYFGKQELKLKLLIRGNVYSICTHTSEPVCHRCWHYILSSGKWSINLNSACTDEWFIYPGLELRWVKYTTQKDQRPYFYASAENWPGSSAGDAPVKQRLCAHGQQILPHNCLLFGWIKK